MSTTWTDNETSDVEGGRASMDGDAIGEVVVTKVDSEAAFGRMMKSVREAVEDDNDSDDSSDAESETPIAVNV